MNMDKIKDIIVENLGVSEDEVTLEARIADDLGADSLDAVEISMAIEEEFGIDVSDDALQSFETVGDIVDYVKAQHA